MNTINSAEYVALIDEREEITELYREWLEEDYEVETFTGDEPVEEFFDHLESNQAPEAVLLDRYTSRRSGFDLPDYLNRLSPETAVVGSLTIRDNSEEFIETTDDYFQLSVTGEELRDIVDRNI